MFYVIAKTGWFLFKPSSLIALCLIAGAILTATARACLGRSLLAVGIAALVIGGLSPVGEWLFLPLENRFPRADLASGRPVTGFIILGGVEDTRTEPRRELASLNDSAERFVEAAALSRTYPDARIVFSGGAGGILPTTGTESETAKLVLEALGVPESRLTLEDRSRDTYENAVFTRQLLAPKPGERWVVITSGWHMPRAIGCFRRAGMTVEAWPVDYRTTGRMDFLVEPGIGVGLDQLDFVMREYVGLVVYYLRGRTDALLPAP